MKKLTTEEFINRARKVHGMKYCYDKSAYKGMLTKVTILCEMHGPFEQRPTDHIREKHGCPKCSHNYPLTSDDFYLRSKKHYGDQYRLESKFQGMKHSITLSCKDHGIFRLSKAEAHFQCNGGCPTCAKLARQDGLKTGNISKAESEWLDNLQVPLRQHQLNINDDYYIVDGFDPDTQTVYEYYGSYWHGNPEIYNPADINTVKQVTFGELYQRTIIRENQLREHYNVVTNWGR